jgi:Zn-dependent protease with chaperone function
MGNTQSPTVESCWWAASARPHTLRSGGFTSVIAIVYVATHIERTPITGRLRYVTLSEEQHSKVCDWKRDLLLDTYRGALLANSDVRVRQVKACARQLVRANGDVPAIRDKHWEVYVIDNELANAYVLTVCVLAYIFLTAHHQNGAIFVHTGILRMFVNMDQLGNVIAHEMAHAVLGHLVRRPCARE